MPWSMIINTLFSVIPGAIGDYFKKKQDIDLKRLDNQALLESEKNKLIAQGIITQGELGQEQIKATSSRFKEFMYCVILAPVVITCFDPAWGKQIFDSLNIVPEWYIFIVSTISLAIWGINSDKVQGILQARREYKLEKLRINRQAYFDAKRKISGPLSQSQVDADNKILDELDNV